MKVAKWGNSLAVRLPSDVIKLLKLNEGDEIELHAEGDRAFSVVKKEGQAELLKRVRAMRGRVPADFKFDRLDAHER
ncbi:AbrB/MazE/SpoVT family DNA-binding domain-containing protein [Spongiibacter sp. KMU-158]|uniref:AbrB/MazE/SpoVT family DNA-binding domain-containing protein n=1 Tax=Spongiibacter pelagi TaxID=2760804 RepID=A0A927GY63_9GAMM|nr:AbrB/MazE/SpoVT family DNA-binding domain-containing protein [Spongiibacter pelagi]MBD2860119.1 AbrB/MazE/SpoVT family DNA-binding domain-containing protein [Spongiibacter pelagi]